MTAANLAKPLKKGRYEHYKGKQYELITIAQHTETLEEYVVYRALYGEQTYWIRPLKMFCEYISKDGQLIPRFRFIGDTTI